MKNYARIQDGRVAELLNTDRDIRGMFHPSLTWIEVSSVQGIREGWTYDGHGFAPSPAPAVAPVVPGVAELQAQLAVLSAQIAALGKAV